MNAALTLTRSFEEMECGACGIVFWVPEQFYKERRESGGDWHCPNGHARVFRELEVDSLKRDLARANDVKRIAEARAVAAERSLTRLKVRIARGVCPACNRSFQDLARHMTTKHTGYDATAHIG